MASIAVDRSSPFTNVAVKRKKKKNRKKNKKAPDAADCAIKSVIEVVSQMFNADEIQQAVQHVKGKDMAVTIDNLIDAVYQVQHEKWELHEEGERPTSDLVYANCTEPSPSVSHFEDEDQNDGKGEESSEEDNQTKEWYQEKISELRIMCQSCHHHQAKMVLLPCGHLACCQYCLHDIQRCQVTECNEIVRGAREVFFVDASS